MAPPELPFDILFLLIDHVSPGDLVNYVLTCREIYAKSTSRLKEHNYLRRQYREVRIDKASEIPPRFQMFEFMENPRILFYIKRLYLRRMSHPYMSGLNIIELFTVDECADILRMSPYFKHYTAHTIADWTSELRGENGEALVALILSMLPNLTFLQIEDYIQPKPDGFLNQMMQTIASSVHRPDQQLHTLGSLSTLKLVYGNDTYLDRGPRHAGAFDLLESFAALPSLRHISGNQCLPGEPSTAQNQLKKTWASNVETLSITFCTITPTQLETLLIKMPKLRSFESYVDYPDGEQGTRAYVPALERCCSSLESLKLCSPHAIARPTTDSPISFKAFERLGNLELDPGVFDCSLYPKPEDASWRLIEMLPASLETLTIFFNQTWHYEVVFDRFAASYESNLPNLRQITVTNCPMDSTADKQIEAELSWTAFTCSRSGSYWQTWKRPVDTAKLPLR